MQNAENAELYFTLRGAKLEWTFSSWPRNASDIHRFPSVHMEYFKLNQLSLILRGIIF